MIWGVGVQEVVTDLEREVLTLALALAVVLVVALRHYLEAYHRRSEWE
ncbi:MAG: hypothetical protein HC840_23260 [Leptolyngbyaceae cyanobacterium RM2_2_4]|nr:hypothetical protein [Leptolyngbyaceae cyanobacterium RM2_2_4]